MAYGQWAASPKLFRSRLYECMQRCSRTTQPMHQHRICYISHQHCTTQLMHQPHTFLSTVHCINIAINPLRLQNFFIAPNLSCLCALNNASCGMQRCYNDTSVQPWKNHTLKTRYPCDRKKCMYPFLNHSIPCNLQTNQ